MIKNIVKVLISNIVVMFTSFINTLVIPKMLSIEGYAEYQTFMLYISYIGLLTFGFHSGLFVKYGGKHKEDMNKEQFKSEMRLVIWSQVIVSLVAIFIGIFTQNILLICTALCILTSNFVSVYKYLYQAWDMFTIFSVISIVQSLGFSLMVLVLGLIKGKLDSVDVIGLYIAINAICFLVVFVSYCREMRGVHSCPIISHENFKIFQIGFLLILGSGANVVFNSVDKFFIKGLFSAYEFSMYCFGITLLNVMNIFISAISQPMYLRLASDINNIQERKEFKEILFCFGGLSGCAYYAVAIVVKYFLPEYMGSLQVVAVLFAIFPAVAVINCLYINLYKATNQIKKYLLSLIFVIVCSVVLNGLGIVIYRNYLSIAVATTICYYIWLLYSSKDFEGLKLNARDIIFLIGFMVIFFGLTGISNAVVGFLVYFLVAILWEGVVYRERVKQIGIMMKRIIRKK